MDDTAIGKLDDIRKLLRTLVSRSELPAALLGLRELAAVLNVGESTLERLKAARKIGPQPVKLGGSLRWRRAEVEAWLRTPTHTGGLHDAKTWPAVWEQMTRSSTFPFTPN